MRCIRSRRTGGSARGKTRLTVSHVPSEATSTLIGRWGVSSFHPPWMVGPSNSGGTSVDGINSRWPQCGQTNAVAVVRITTPSSGHCGCAASSRKSITTAYVGGRRDDRYMPPETLLAFERAHPRHDGTKEETIRAELGVTPARYYVLLWRAARSVEGMAADAITARRVRERSERARSSRDRRVAA